MRVALVQEHVDVARGGAEASTWEMARAIARQGPQVTLLCRGPSAERWVQDGVNVSPIVVRGWSRAQRTYHFIRQVHAVCRVERFDIVQAITPCLMADVYQPRGGTYAETIARNAMRFAPALRPLYSVGRLFNIRQRFLQRLEQYLLDQRASRVRVAAISRYVRSQVVDGMGFSADRVRVVFNGVDVLPLHDQERVELRRQWRNEAGIDEQTPVLLFVGHNFRLKGLATLLNAVARGASEWRLVIAGRGRRRAYERQAQRLGLADRVRFAESDVAMRTLYAATDVLGHPTWYDPCSRVVLEALSLGLPVVTTRFNGAAEVVTPGTHGVVIDDPGDVSAVVAGLHAALAPEVRNACRAAAGAMHTRLSMERHARELLELYEEVVADRAHVNDASRRDDLPPPPG